MDETDFDENDIYFIPKRIFTALIHHQERDERSGECVLMLEYNRSSDQPFFDLSGGCRDDTSPVWQIADRLWNQYSVSIQGYEDNLDWEYTDEIGEKQADRQTDQSGKPSAQAALNIPEACYAPLLAAPYNFLCDFLSVDFLSLMRQYIDLLSSKDAASEKKEQFEALYSQYMPFSFYIGLRHDFNFWCANGFLEGCGIATNEHESLFFLVRDYILLQSFAYAYIADPARFSVPDCLDAFRRYYDLYDDSIAVMPAVRREAKQDKEKLAAQMLDGTINLTKHIRRLPIFSGRAREGRPLVSSSSVGLIADMLGMVVADKLPIKVCQYCGRYFVPLSRSDEKYCLRPIEPGSDRTCRSVGPNTAFQAGLKKDNIKSESRRLYNLLYNRKKYHADDPIYQQEFETFRAENQKRKAAYKSGRLSEAAYTEWLEEMSLKYTKPPKD